MLQAVYSMHKVYVFICIARTRIWRWSWFVLNESISTMVACLDGMPHALCVSCLAVMSLTIYSSEASSAASWGEVWHCAVWYILWLKKCGYDALRMTRYIKACAKPLIRVECYIYCTMPVQSVCNTWERLQSCWFQLNAASVIWLALIHLSLILNMPDSKFKRTPTLRLWWQCFS